MINYRWGLKAQLYRIFRSWFPFNIILKRENQNLKLLLQSFETKGKKVIDLGSGTGNVLQFFQDADQLWGIDITLEMLRIAKQLFPDAVLVQANVSQLPLKKESFDVVTAVGVSEYLKNPEPLFEETRRILKSTGHLLITYSPSGIWTGFRSLLGHRIYPGKLEQIKATGERTDFQFVKQTHSFMQCQVLFQKM